MTRPTDGDRFAWVTDPHLDQVPSSVWRNWIETLHQIKPDGLILTGDVSEGDDVLVQLRQLASAVECPVYFVLGNHDFYDSSVAAMRQACVTLAREVPNLFYLTDCGPIELTPSVALLGDDGWGDATRGDYERSPIRLRDFQHISDFCDQPKATWQTTLQSLGASSANRLAEKASRLHDEIQVVVVATHVPPFPEACWYEGHTTDELWAPFFVCGQLGDALRRMADASLKRSWIVLCGHTHHDGIANISDNLVVHTGHSTYGEVGIESIIRVGPGHVEVPRTPTTGSF